MARTYSYIRFVLLLLSASVVREVDAFQNIKKRLIRSEKNLRDGQELGLSAGMDAKGLISYALSRLSAGMDKEGISINGDAELGKIDGGEDAKTGRYWRLLNNAEVDCHGTNKWKVKEVKFFDGLTQLETTEGESKGFSDSHETSAQDWQPVPKWAFDGQTDAAFGGGGRCWSSDTGAGKEAGVSYIGYDFGQSVTVDGFEIMQFGFSCGTSSIKVQYSDDQSTWSDLWTQSTNAGPRMAPGPLEDYRQKAPTPAEPTPAPTPAPTPYVIPTQAPTPAPAQELQASCARPRCHVSV